MHFPQLPDLIGWDVLSTAPIICADDWQCSQTGPVEDIHFWGSWKNLDGMPQTDDYPPGGEMPTFAVFILRNIPADIDTPWSRPGEILWERFELIEGTPYDPPTLESWYNPVIDSTICNDHIPYWRYDFVDIPEPFIQYKDSIYWLAVANVNVNPPYEWGWKNSRDHFEDDAVWSDDPYQGRQDATGSTSSSARTDTLRTGGRPITTARDGISTRNSSGGIYGSTTTRSPSSTPKRSSWISTSKRLGLSPGLSSPLTGQPIYGISRVSRADRLCRQMWQECRRISL
jgi:hypothetical protein